MYTRVLALIKERMRDSRYVMTLHAEEEMDNDDGPSGFSVGFFIGPR